jgi:predicted transcriptional regulator
MSLLMPIKPEPASRIYGGRKWFEFRKSKPPSCGFVYLHETKDQTDSVQAIRGGFYFDEFLKLPIDQLWIAAGCKAAASKESYYSYYKNFRTGIALAIKRVELLRESVTPRMLADLDTTLRPPKYSWTYLQLSDSSPAKVFLDNLTRSSILEGPPNGSV